jgi:type I restriction enzyme S subunit
MAQHADMKAIPEKGFNIEGVIWKPYKGGSKFINGDVLFARITPCLENGKTGIVDFLKEGEVGFGSTEFIVFRSKEKIKTPFIACLARNEDFRMRCIQSMVGSSGRQRVQNTVFDDIKLSFDNELLSLFDNITSPFFEDMSSSKHQNISLQNLRDTLLPKLISGELRVQEAEKIIADHG